MSQAVYHMQLPILRWYVVANRQEAVIFRGNRKGLLGYFLRLENLSTPRRGKEKKVEMPLKRAYTPTKFAKLVAQKVEDGRSHHLYDELVLIAEPKFLGKLRKSFSAAVLATVRDEIPHDVSPISTGEVQGLLQKRQIALAA